MTDANMGEKPAISLAIAVLLAEKGTCEVRLKRKPDWCPAWPECGCKFQPRAALTSTAPAEEKKC